MCAVSAALASPTGNHVIHKARFAPRWSVIAGSHLRLDEVHHTPTQGNTTPPPPPPTQTFFPPPLPRVLSDSWCMHHSRASNLGFPDAASKLTATTLRRPFRP